MRRFTETDKDNLFWWSPEGRCLPPPAQENAGWYGPPLQHLRSGFSADRRQRLRAGDVDGPQARAFPLDRSMRYPEVHDDPALPLPTGTEKLSYAAWSRADPLCSAHPPRRGPIVAEALGISLPHPPNRDSLFEYTDYYKNSGFPVFRYACSVGVRRELQGEPPPRFDNQALLDDAFPRNLWMEE
jgi:hypothetical protein